MDHAVQWLRGAHGSQADEVRLAYQLQLNPETPSGGLVIDDLARLCRATKTTFAAGDPYLTAFQEGQRSVWLHVVSMLALSPAAVAALQARLMREIER